MVAGGGMAVDGRALGQRRRARDRARLATQVTDSDFRPNGSALLGELEHISAMVARRVRYGFRRAHPGKNLRRRSGARNDPRQREFIGLIEKSPLDQGLHGPAPPVQPLRRRGVLIRRGARLWGNAPPTAGAQKPPARRPTGLARHCRRRNGFRIPRANRAGVDGWCRSAGTPRRCAW
jgi:hypothetical protein